MQISGRVSLCRTVTKLFQSMITSNFQMSSVPSRWAWWPPPAPSTPAASCWSVSPPRWAPSGAAGRPGGVKSACWHEGAQFLHHLLLEDGQLAGGVFSCFLTRRYGRWKCILYNVLLSSLVLDPINLSSQKSLLHSVAQADTQSAWQCCVYYRVQSQSSQATVAESWFWDIRPAKGSN